MTPLIATYRLQLRSDFTFAHAAAAIPYLRRLGISHVYLSPIWQSVPGSQHGYDVTDHSKINEDLGGLAGLYDLARVARDHDMELILDIVPNHVGIASHPWWRDVLRYGASSRFAPYFDIDWEGQPQLTTGVLVYPVLGQPFGRALEAGEFTLAFDGAELVVQYYDRTFPIAPAQYLKVLGLPPVSLPAEVTHELVASLEGMTSAAPDAANILLERFGALLNNHPEVREWVDQRLESYTGTPGRPSSFDALDSVLSAQHYRLANWRVSAEEINYRRFFDINELAAIRVEHEPAFAATHELIAQLIEGGVATGLRVDHVDGLYDPGGYLQSIRALWSGDRTPGIWVEKILAAGELLPESWPVAGTTGYDFLAIADGLLIDSSARQAFTVIYDDFIGQRTRFSDIAFAARRRIAGRAFAGEVNVLALQLYRLARERRAARDNTLGALRDAIASLLSAMPVYRTYLQNDAPMDRDRELITAARVEALRRDANLSEDAMDFLVQVLLLEQGADDAQERERWVHFRRRFQQLSGPVMAKGVEDTSFFRYHRLLACNEVGADPDHFGVAPEEAHRAFADRAANWPLALSATTTHDTKRSEDARMRLAALSGEPRAWHREVRAWARMNHRHLQQSEAGPIPDANTEYYIYQTLVASWEGLHSQSYRSRITEHMTKALREAKLATSWTRVDEEYEATVLAFVDAVLDRRKSRRFLQRLDQFVKTLEPAAAVSSLALVALKCTLPGVPDFYQGSESALHALTDPDNRRAVDFPLAERRLSATTESSPPDPLAAGAKTWLTTRLLQLRRAFPSLFQSRSYLPLETTGTNANHVFAFAREDGDAAVIVLVPRALGRLMGTGFSPAAWADTAVDLPAGIWRDFLCGGQFAGSVLVRDLFGEFPIAVLVRTGAGP